MRVKHEQIPNTIKFLQIDFPALVLQTAGIEDKDEYWQQVVEQCNIVSEKYNKNEFVDYMVEAYVGYLNKMYLKAKGITRRRINEQNERV